MQKNNWEERFDEEFPRAFISINHSPWDRAERVEADAKIVKSFIAQILEEEKERLVGEIEKMMNEYRMRECPMKGRISQCTKDMCFHWMPSWQDIINLIKK